MNELFKIGKNNYITNNLLITVDNDYPKLNIQITETDSINNTVTYNFKLLSTYDRQIIDLIDDALYMYNKDKKTTI